MKTYNPKTPKEIEEEAAFEKFLQGDDSALTDTGPGGHHH
jgi:hypothetical protein